MGPDGVLREYDYADGHPSESTSQVQEKIEATEDDAAGECS